MRFPVHLRRSALLTSTAIAILGPLLCASDGAPHTITSQRSTVESGSAENLPQGVSISDWASIRAAYEAARFTAYSSPTGYQARNPGQGWMTTFDGRGFATQPTGEGWTWGLQVESYGFAEHAQSVCEPTSVAAQGQRIAYDWDDNLLEWWINDTRGLEHGYTILQRPPHAEGQPITITLSVRGDLVPQVQCDGRGVLFRSAAGAAVVNYSGLTVIDAAGRSLDARFECVGARTLRLQVDEREARYPLTIDPLAQHAYLKASNTGAGDSFGKMVSVSGDTVVVGAPLEDSNATGVNGNQADDTATDAGAAYVFVRSGGSWSQQAYLKASNTDAGDWFGYPVWVSGDTVVVGAIFEDSNATGVNGDQANNTAPDAGAVYVFVRNGSSWSQQAYLKASNTGINDQFGYSLSASNDTVVVGVPLEDSNATGVDGNEADNTAPDAGAAYVFVRSGSSWSQQAYLKASNTDAGDLFGYPVSVSGETVVIGAAYEDSNATGVNGNQANNTFADAGAAYAFVRSGGSWSQQAYLKASNTGINDLFGYSLSLSGDTIVVGADQEDSNATGANGNQADDTATDAGAAYVFVRSGGSWSQQAYLKASNTGSYDNFGDWVSLSGDTVVVSAALEDSNATGVNGNQADDTATDAGAAYVFVRSGGSWSQQAYLKASNTDAGDRFGYSLSVSGDTVVVGATKEDSNATGVNGNQTDNTATDSGSVYVFKLDPILTAYCFGDGSGTHCPCSNNSPPGNDSGCANSLGLSGALLATGVPSLSSDTVVLTGSGMPNGAALYFQGTASTNGGAGTVFGDGLRCTSGTIVRLGTKINAGGSSQYPNGGDLSVSVRGNVLTPSVRTYQTWYRNAATFCTPSTFNLTNGVVIAWGA
jgi:hypothetical protein